jgi:RNA polymerase sigma factor for flagellar operon FliA
MTMPASPARNISARIAARNDLVRLHTGLVHFIARRLHGALSDEADLDELVSAGMVGLMAAAESFDASRGLAFSTHATTRVRGAMLDELRRLDRVPRSVRAKARHLHQVRNSLGHRFGRRPEEREVAAAAGLDIDTFWRWQDDVRSGATLTLDAPYEDTPDGEPSLGERLPDHSFDLDVELDREIEREQLREAIKQLGLSEQRVLSLYFFEERTLQEIAVVIGLTESGVSRIRARALRQLRAVLELSGFAAAA